MKLIRVHDCSNSDERPQHRGGGGPKENDVMRYLRQNAIYYGCEWTDDFKSADVIITNDVFPEHCLVLTTPRLKRMDGVFWQRRYQERNEPLNKAAHQADHVIFISEFSRQSYHRLYGENLESSSVALNWVNPQIFYPRKIAKFSKFTLVAIATDWSREEKRLDAILQFAEGLYNTQIILIGTCQRTLPHNIKSVGYLEDNNKVADLLSQCHIFLNFSYRDAAPKVVSQGLCCGLPVLYAASGGVPELVGSNGLPIPDQHEWAFEEQTPLLNLTPAFKLLRILKENYGDYRLRDTSDQFSLMLGEYFQQIRRLADIELRMTSDRITFSEKPCLLHQMKQ